MTYCNGIDSQTKGTFLIPSLYCLLVAILEQDRAKPSHNLLPNYMYLKPLNVGEYKKKFQLLNSNICTQKCFYITIIKWQ